MMNKEETLELSDNGYSDEYIINKIYDSIGHCKECRFGSKHIDKNLIECSKGYWAHKENWFCADFERLQDD